MIYCYFAYFNEQQHVLVAKEDHGQIKAGNVLKSELSPLDALLKSVEAKAADSSLKEKDTDVDADAGGAGAAPSSHMPIAAIPSVIHKPQVANPAEDVLNTPEENIKKI